MPDRSSMPNPGPTAPANRERLASIDDAPLGHETLDQDEAQYAAAGIEITGATPALT